MFWAACFAEQARTWQQIGSALLAANPGIAAVLEMNRRMRLQARPLLTQVGATGNAGTVRHAWIAGHSWCWLLEAKRYEGLRSRRIDRRLVAVLEAGPLVRRQDMWRHRVLGRGLGREGARTEKSNPHHTTLLVSSPGHG